MKIGIIGLPYSGKTTVFNALTGASAKVGGGAATAKPNISVIKVPDERIDILAKMFNPKKVVYADLTFIDECQIGIDYLLWIKHLCQYINPLIRHLYHTYIWFGCCRPASDFCTCTREGIKHSGFS